MNNRHQFFSSSKSANKSGWGREQFLSELGQLLDNQHYWCEVTNSHTIPEEIDHLKNALLSGNNKSTVAALQKGMNASSPVLQVFFSTLMHYLSKGFDKSSHDLRRYMKTMHDSASQLMKDNQPRPR